MKAILPLLLATCTIKASPQEYREFCYYSCNRIEECQLKFDLNFDDCIEECSKELTTDLLSTYNVRIAMDAINDMDCDVYTKFFNQTMKGK